MTHPQAFGQKFTPIRRFLAWKTHPFWPHIPNMTQYGSAPRVPSGGMGSRMSALHALCVVLAFGCSVGREWRIAGHCDVDVAYWLGSGRIWIWSQVLGIGMGGSLPSLCEGQVVRVYAGFAGVGLVVWVSQVCLRLEGMKKRTMTHYTFPCQLFLVEASLISLLLVKSALCPPRDLMEKNHDNSIPTSVPHQKAAHFTAFPKPHVIFESHDFLNENPITTENLEVKTYKGFSQSVLKKCALSPLVVNFSRGK